MKLKDIEGGVMKIPSEWYTGSSAKDFRRRTFMSWAIMNAEMEDCEVNGIQLSRGQLLTSLRQISAQTGMSIQTVRTTLKELQYFIVLTHEVTHEVTHGGILVTICNYDSYVGSKNGTNTRGNTRGNTRTSSNTLSKTNTKNRTKLDESSTKKGISSDTGVSDIEEANVLTWRDDYNVYLSELRSAYISLTSDADWLAERRRFNPGVDILLTMEKAVKEYWATPAGWEHKKKSRTKDIDWKTTFNMAISMKNNKVYERFERQSGNYRVSGGLTDDEVSFLECIADGTYTPLGSTGGMR